MDYYVKLFADTMLVEPSQYKEVVITCRAVDLIVNRVFELANEETTEEAP